MINYSIIIPHKNTPELLERCLSSIPKRNDIQIIIIDDNSDPKLINYENFPGSFEKNVELVFLKKDKGAGHARNIGLAKAKGKWLLFPDSDDFYSNNALSVLDKYINSNHEIIYFGAEYIDNITLKSRNIKKLKFENYNPIDKEDITKFRYIVNSSWNKLYNADFINKLKIKYQPIPKGNDYFFTHLANYYCKKFHILSEALYFYTFRIESISHKKSTVDVYLFELANRINLNSFFKFIQRKDLIRSPTWRFFFKVLKETNPKFFINFLLLIIKNKDLLKSQSNSLLNFINKRDKLS